MTNSYKLTETPWRLFRFLCCLVLMTGLSASVFAQTNIANYSQTTSTGNTYTPITGGTVAHSGAYDDAVATAVPIGGTLTFGGSTFTTCYISTNGFIGFGTALGGTVYTPLSSGTTGGVIAAYAQDAGASTAAGAVPEIRYETIGNEFIVQYKDHANFYNRTTERLNFQIRCDFSTGVINIIYGTCTAPPTVSATETSPKVGLRGNSTTFASNVNALQIGNVPTATTCNWSSAVPANANSSTMLHYGTTNANVSIPSGLMYTWTPQSVVAPVRTFSAVASITTSGATMAWTAPTGATQYNVQYRTVGAGSCSWTNWSGNPVTGASLALTGLASSTTYQVRVQAIAGANQAPYSHIPNQAGSGNGYAAAGTFTTASPPPAITTTSPTSNYCSSGGQTIVITGTDFVGVVANGVKFNGTNATSYVVNSATQITAVSPVGITAGNLTVQTAAGTSTGYAYTVNTNPTVVVNSPSVCGAYPTALNASGASTYSWSPSTSLSAATGATVTLTASAGGAITVTGTDAFGCTGTAVSTITYTAPPAVTVTPSAPYFCGSGGTTNLVATSPNDPNYTYTFSLLDFGSLTNVTSNSADFNITQTSAARLAAVDNTALCASTVNTSIGVYSFPTLTMSATPSTVCVGGTSVLGSGLSAGNFSSGTITHAPITVPGTATNLAAGGTATTALTSGTLDDGGWGAIPVGFTFNFFGTSYTALNAGTNGNVMFGTYNGTALGDFNFATLPSNTEPLNMIAILAMDNDLRESSLPAVGPLSPAGVNGTVSYFTTGYAPNRKFVLTYTNAREYGDTKVSTAQLILYETTGIIEVHVTSSTNIDRNKVVGVNNGTGTVGVLAFASGTVAAANNPIVTSFAYRFTPPSNYTTTWTPSGDISGANTGTNLFTRTTNALSTPGTNSFNFVAQDQTTGCTNGAGTPVDVEVLAVPAVIGASEISAYGSILGVGSATTTSPLVICGSQTVTGTFTGTLTGPEVVRWWSASTGGTMLGTGTSYTTPTLTPGSYSVWAEVYNGICGSASRTQFDVTNNTPPTVTVTSLGPDLDINCGVGPTYAMDYQASSSNPGYAYTWTGDANNTTFTDNGSGSASVTSDETTISTVVAFDGVSGCQTTALKPLSVFAFPSPTLTADPATICVGGTSELSSGVTQGNFSVTPCISAPSYNRLTTGSPTYLVQNGVGQVATTSCNFCPLDDAGWGAIPIGFSFNFFGTGYSTLNVGTNGNVMFGTYNGANPGGLADFNYANAFPSTLEPFNMIALCAADLNAGLAGANISYWTTGVSPNQIFVLDYDDVPGFGTDGLYSMQLQLHETTGYFEIHVGEATGVGFNALKSIGVNNGDGTIGANAPRCQGGLWNGNLATITAAFPQAWGFTPPVDYTFDWETDSEITGPDDEANATATPTTAVPATVTYSLTVTDNTSGCVGLPFTVDVDVIAPPVAPDVDGEGDFSAVSSTNTINFCGPQTVTMAVSAGGNPGDIAHYYSDAGLTTEVFEADPYTDPYTTAEVGANTSLWVTLDNGTCEGPAQQVDLVFQAADAIIITNDSPSNCGVGPFTGNLSASSTASYTYTWDANIHLNTTSGANVTASGITQTTAFHVSGDDGYCFNDEFSSMGVYDFPVVTPTSSVDSVCTGGTSILNSNVSASTFTVVGQGYSPISSTGWTVTDLCSGGTIITPMSDASLDDGIWSSIPIGFTFNYFGNTYTTVNISTNGNLQFSSTSDVFTPGAIPNVATPNNYVALCWADLILENPGTYVRTWTAGVAPNRVFVVAFNAEFFDGNDFSDFASGQVLGQMELYETTGVVEVHLNTSSGQATTGGGVKVLGVENSGGTVGAAAPGRNGTAFQVTIPEGWRFEPPHDYSFSWAPGGEITGATNLTTATASPSATTTYQLTVTDNVTLCAGDPVDVTVIVTTAPPVAVFNGAPSNGTTGGVLTTHIMNNLSTNVNGATYAWTFTPNTVTYVDGTSATDRNPHVQFNGVGNYGASMTITTCTGSATYSVNNYFHITPEYCFPSWVFGCVDDNIDGVVITNPANVTIMSNTGTDCSGTPSSWSEFAPVAGVTSCTFYQGSTYDVTVSTSAGFTEFFGLWLDVNNDGDFGDPGEFMGASATPALSSTFSIGIASEGVIYGAHRMRVICEFYDVLTAGDYCIQSDFGEGEDYTVYIVPPVQPNDIPTFASNVAYSVNTNYPTCYPINGNTSLATNSPESTTYSGNDVWYKFVAHSTAVSITMTSAGFDDVIELYSKVGGNYILVPGGSENASGGNGDFERLNVGGLTVGTTYYVSVGCVNASGSGAFQLCIQHLMPSYCAYTIPAGGFALCDAYKAIYRGSPAQGVTYNFNFLGTGGGAPAVTTSIVGTNGLTTLSQSVLALRYGGIYNASVDVVYTLNPSTGPADVITVVGSPASPNCTGVFIRPQPNLEVKLAQRCPATLLRSNYLIGTPISGDPNACSATGYTYSFESITACGGSVVSAFPTEFNTPAATPYLPLGALPLLPNQGAWRVRIRPNFTYGNGTYGPPQDIKVNSTAAGLMAPEEEISNNNEKSETVFGVQANLYPNPNNGEMVNLNVSGVKSDNVFVRIVDAMGRVVYTNRFTVDGSLNTIVTFTQPLASGLYQVEFTVDGQLMTERMIVSK